MQGKKGFSSRVFSENEVQLLYSLTIKTILWKSHQPFTNDGNGINDFAGTQLVYHQKWDHWERTSPLQQIVGKQYLNFCCFWRPWMLLLNDIHNWKVFLDWQTEVAISHFNREMVAPGVCNFRGKTLQWDAAWIILADGQQIHNLKFYSLHFSR